MSSTLLVQSGLLVVNQPQPQAPLVKDAPSDAAVMQDAWLARFHAGDRDVLTACYRDHFAVVDAAAGRVLRGADRETVVHEVFLRLVARPDFRRGFRGGSIAGWLATVAHNAAIDFWRRYRRETAHAAGTPELSESSQRMEDLAEARILVERFRKSALPPQWERVFQARFIEQLDQRTAAARLGMRRTTLAYQEIQIRRCLKRFLDRGAP